MKNNFLPVLLCLACLFIGGIHSCTKDIPTTTPPDSVITTSFIEEFKDVYMLTINTGWVVKDNSADSINPASAPWEQGQVGTDKAGNSYGFPAYSSDKAEYAFSPGAYSSISSWLITPVLSVKNGDKISFYTRTDSKSYTDRMQVLINKSTSTDVGNSLNSVGSFTTVLFDINSTQVMWGYPATWTKYEYTFSGISGKINTRIAFRHYVVDPQGVVTGVGIDLFKFLAN
jgi:hypothetical protein